MSSSLSVGSFFAGRWRAPQTVGRWPVAGGRWQRSSRGGVRVARLVPTGPGKPWSKQPLPGTGRPGGCTHASLILAGTHAVERAELHYTQLQQAIASRDVIGQAKGILMDRRGISADEAFDLLRHTSNDLNVKLADLAATLATHPANHDLPHR